MYEFTISWYLGDELITDDGLVAAKSLAEASNKLDEYYGKNNIASLTLTWLDDEDYLIYNSNTKSIREYLRED